MKTKALISSSVTAQLICAFVFAYAKCRFSHDVAYIGLVMFQLSEDVCLELGSAALNSLSKQMTEQTGTFMLTCPCNLDPLEPHFYMSLDVRKPVFGVSDLV